MTSDLFGLLTRIRVSKVPMDLEKAAAQQHLFVLVGLVVGLVVTAFSVLLYDLLGRGLAQESAVIVIITLYSITGILHTEGLADFADGVMAGGTPERKRAAMKDVHLGAGGVFAIVFFLVIMFALIASISAKAVEPVIPFPLPWAAPFAIGFVLSEMAGKLAMNIMMFLGPSSHPGMGTLFVKGANGTKLLAATLLASVISFVLVGWLFLIVLLGLVVGCAVTQMARKNFGGVSGDAFGAANEVGRLVTLLVWVIAA